MQIVLSKVAEDPRCIYKHPTDAITLQAQIKDASSIMQPTFYLTYDADLIEQHYNYAQAWGRYYFIADMQIDIGGTIYIKCNEDVLYTYADQIVQCPIVAERSKNAFNAFIQDADRRFYQYTQQQYITIGTDIGCPDIICMCTVG